MEKTVEKLEQIIVSKDAKIHNLEMQIKNLNAMLFGSKSEKQVIVNAPSSQLFLPFEGHLFPVEATKPDAEVREVEDEKRARKVKAPGNQFIFPQNVPTEEITLDIPESEKSDPITGAKFRQISTESTKKLVRVAASYKIIIFNRPVYGAGEHGVIKMDLPESIIGSSRLDESVWAEVCVRHKCYHTPFHRQVQIFARDGVDLTRQTLNKGSLNIATALVPLGRLLHDEILKFPAVYVDETTIKMQVRGEKKLKNAYLWTLCGRPPGHTGEPLVWMHFEGNRNHANAKTLLKDYSGFVHSDVYRAYEALSKRGQYTWGCCWVHARRKFINATPCPFQEEVIAQFTAIMKADNLGDELKGQDRIQHRQKNIRPLVEALEKYLAANQLRPEVMVSESLSNACGYFLKRTASFKTFLDSDIAEMDNNTAERSIRPLKIGNKNWLFVGSKNGGEACAILTSLLQSAKNIGINPQKYLENVMRRLPYTPKERLHELLPHKWQEKINPKSPYLPPDYPA